MPMPRMTSTSTTMTAMTIKVAILTPSRAADVSCVEYDEKRLDAYLGAS